MTKFITLSEAAALIPANITLALGGMTIYRRPVAFVRALLQRHVQKNTSDHADVAPLTPQENDLREGMMEIADLHRAVSPNADVRGLTLLCFTAGFESDLLVGAGCVSTIRSCYFGLQEFGFAPMFTAAAQNGTITLIEETEASIVMGIRAQMAGVGFMPSLAWQGTDLLKLRPDVKSITDPYTGETLTAFPAIHCDVTVLHALEADKQGNVKLNNNLGIDNELAYLADTVIVTAERIVDHIERSTDGIIIPAPAITHIVHAPNGAYPTSCYPAYPVAGGEFMRYVEACNAGKFDSYLNEFLGK